MKERAINLDGDLMPPSLVGVMVLLDRSGSMRGIRSAMETAFNDFVQAQRADHPERMWLSLYQFDSDGYDAVYVRAALDTVGPLHLVPRGNTPLIDSMYRLATAAEQVIDDPTDLTERLLLVVITDGQENASTQHTWAQLRELVGQVEGPQCELLFMGTTDAVLQAEDQLPAMASGGGTFTYAATPVGAHYAAGGMTVGAMAAKAGRSAKSLTRSYAAASAGGEKVMSNAALREWMKQQGLAQDEEK